MCRALLAFTYWFSADSPGRAVRHRARCSWLLALVLWCGGAGTVTAQAPGPSATPPPVSGSPAQQIRSLSGLAREFVPTVKRVVEGAMLRRYTFLATIFAQLIMLAALLKLQAEKPGATRDFFAHCARFIVLLPLITLGPWLISYLYTLGWQLVSPLRVTLETSAQEFNDSYTRFTMGIFTATDRGGVYQPFPTGTEAIVGVLSDQPSSVRTVNQLLDPAQWDMTKLFSLLNLVRGIISFAEFLLIILSGFLMIAFRLAVPWMLALSLDKALAHEVSYKFARGVVVYTLVYPIVAHIIAIIAFKIGTLGLAIYDGTPMYNVDPQTALLIASPHVDPVFCFGVAIFMMAVAALCLLASPVIAWKIAFGQTFEGVATIASGWMAAIVGSGINFVSARMGASLGNMAERLQVETQAAAGRTTAQADYQAALKTNAAGLHNQLGQLNAQRVGAVMLTQAAAQRDQTNLWAVYRNSVAQVQVTQQAQSGLIEAERAQANRQVQNQTALTQGQAVLQANIANNNNEQGWWTWGTQMTGAVGGAVVAGGAGAGVGSSLGSAASQPGALMTDQQNIELRTGGTISLANENLARTAASNTIYAGARQEVEQQRAAQTQAALGAQYGAQAGAVQVWQGQATQAAQTQAALAGQAATESKGMLDQAARVKWDGAQTTIPMIEAAGLEAASYRRMAQIIGQVTHDMARRVEEMGQYRF